MQQFRWVSRGNRAPKSGLPMQHTIALAVIFIIARSIGSPTGTNWYKIAVMCEGFQGGTIESPTGTNWYNILVMCEGFQGAQLGAPSRKQRPDQWAGSMGLNLLRALPPSHCKTRSVAQLSEGGRLSRHYGAPIQGAPETPPVHHSTIVLRGFKGVSK